MKYISDLELNNEKGAVATLEDYDDPTDPKKIGPGYWNFIHRKSFDARNEESQLDFIQDMKYICYGFFCTKCRAHCTEYIEAHPLEEYLGVMVEVNNEKLPIGMFLWTWRFHNAVNERLHKPIMNFNAAYNLFSGSDDMICGLSCLESDISTGSSSDPTAENKYIPVSSPKPFRYIPVNRS